MPFCCCVVSIQRLRNLIDCLLYTLPDIASLHFSIGFSIAYEWMFTCPRIAMYWVCSRTTISSARRWRSSEWETVRETNPSTGAWACSGDTERVKMTCLYFECILSTIRNIHTWQFSRHCLYLSLLKSRINKRGEIVVRCVKSIATTKMLHMLTNRLSRYWVTSSTVLLFENVRPSESIVLIKG